MKTLRKQANMAFLLLSVAAIVPVYGNGANIQSFQDVDAQIEVFKQHKQSLEAQLAQVTKLVKTAYIPQVLNVAGGALLSAAVIGSIASVVSPVVSYAIFNRPENKGNVSYPWGPFTFTKSVKGAGYWDNVIETFKTPTFPDTATPEVRVSRTYIMQLPLMQKKMAILGTVSPVLAIYSVVAASIAKYLFNKAASYNNEIVRLEEEIEKAEAVIKVLEAHKQ